MTSTFTRRSTNLCAAAALLALSASIGCAQAAPIDIGSNFTFHPSGDMTATASGTVATISEPATTGTRGTETAFFSSNFTITGDFTASVHQLFAIAPVGGSQEIAAFEVGFVNGGETVQYVINDAGGQLFPPFWFGTLSPGLSGQGVGPLTGHYGATLQVQRIGDTVSLAYDGTVYFSGTDPQFGGAANFLLIYENGDGNPGAGAVRWDNFTTGPVGVPGPIAGAGLPGLIFAGGGFLAWWRRKRAALDALAA
jgi:hypothetical protein